MLKYSDVVFAIVDVEVVVTRRMSQKNELLRTSYRHFRSLVLRVSGKVIGFFPQNHHESPWKRSIHVKIIIVHSDPI